MTPEQRIADTKVCTKCKVEKPLGDFTQRTKDLSYVSRCKPCIAAYVRLDYTERNRAKENARKEVWRKANWERVKALTYLRRDPKKHKARAAINNAVKAGKFSRGGCRECGSPKTDFHHSNGYDEKNWFTGFWLCRVHHAELHKELRWNNK